ncbi:MAG: DUF898 domain-containing protein [Deltaproteobacteria bacterium]|nr:DUF898 domain-containing protein [Deltaproteobacteria bacterium]
MAGRTPKCKEPKKIFFIFDDPSAYPPAPSPETEEESLIAGVPQRPALQLKFTGTGREYFRIWIVNLCLTLLTLGIFSAWAKVRKKHYFYSHTKLAGTPFQYLGQPIPILRGRIIGALLFLAYFVASHFLQSTLPYLLVIGLVVAPWVVIRSAAFNARYSAFRNITFSFKSDWRAAAQTLYWLGIIPIYVLGAFLHWWEKGKFVAVATLIGMILFPYWVRRLKAYLICNISYGGKSAKFTAKGDHFFVTYFVAALIVTIVGAAGIFGTYAIRSHYSIPITAQSLLPYVMIYSAYALAYAYVQTRITNLVWSNTRLGPLRFEANLRFGEMAKLYIVNAAAILASAGLLIPWAIIRSVRYRVEQTKVIPEAELSEFRGRKGAAVSAAGAETIDLFDMDISV